MNKLNLLSLKQRIINILFKKKYYSLKINSKLFINQNTNVTRLSRKTFHSIIIVLLNL